MNEEILTTDGQQRELRIGDFLMWGWGWGSRICVARGKTSQNNLQVVEVYDAAWGEEQKGVNIKSRPGCMRSTRDTVFKLEQHWLNDFLHPEVVRVLMNERAKVLNGEYDKKKK